MKLKELICERLKSISLIDENVKTKLAAVAQAIYNDWKQDEEGYDEELGGGGICHIIAEDMQNVLSDMGLWDVQTVCSDEPHVYLVGKFKEGVFMIDIPYHIYESGGGFTWKKKPDVVFDSSHVVIYRLDPNARKFKQYIEDY